jgi:multiple sugar transport system substrate-binding protein
MIAKPRKQISSDKKLWIWAVVMTAGLLVFWILTRGNLPAVIDRTLVFAQWWEDELEEGVLEALAEDFERQNPGFKIRLERKSRDEVKALIAGTPADAKARKKKGADIYSLEGFWLNDLADNLLPLNAVDGENRALPVISFINPLFYNIGLLKAAGFNRPPKNQAELLAYAQAIANSGKYGAILALGGDNPDSVNRQLLSWIWPAALIRSENGGDAFQFTSKAVVETLSFLNQLKPFLYPAPFAVTEETRLAVFTDGKAAMMIGPVSDIAAIRKKTNNEFGITTIPAPAAYVGKPVFSLSTWYAGIAADSGQPEKAAAFTAFLAERASLLARSAFAVPGSGKRDSELTKTDPLYSKACDMYDAGEMVRETGRARALNAVIYEEVKRMFEGVQTPEETAAAIQRRWEG